MKTKKTHLFPFQKLIILMLIAVFTSCGFFRAPGKDNCDKILSREQMTDILTDIYILEAYMRDIRLPSSAADDSAKVFYRALFNKHDVEFEVFQKALDCYLLDRREMEHIHEQILSDLSIKESELERLLKDKDL